MKIFILIISMIILSSCGKKEVVKKEEDKSKSVISVNNNSTVEIIKFPGCEDSNVLKKVKAIVMENERSYVHMNGIENVKIEITDIFTISKNEELKSCECEGNVSGNEEYHGEKNIKYFVQQNSKGETLVKLKK